MNDFSGLGFWIFLSTLFVCDAWIFSQGCDSFFHSHKTKEEKEIQKAKAARLKRNTNAD